MFKTREPIQSRLLGSFRGSLGIVFKKIRFFHFFKVCSWSLDVICILGWSLSLQCLDTRSHRCRIRRYSERKRNSVDGSHRDRWTRLRSHRCRPELVPALQFRCVEQENFIASFSLNFWNYFRRKTIDPRFCILSTFVWLIQNQVLSYSQLIS